MSGVTNKKKKIFKYEIDLNERYGEGSQGSVYNCIDTQNQLCAKIVKVQDNKSFHNEKQILQKLLEKNSKHLVSIQYFNFNEITNELTIIMQRCQSTLKEEIKKRNISKKYFSDEEIEDFLQQLLSGYQILYDANILHRDLKPENILIKDDFGKQIYQLTDFGISKFYNGIPSLDVTMIGTPLYVSPELSMGTGTYKIEDSLILFQNDKFPQSRCDIFSLGLIIHEMITGDLPFKPTKAIQFKQDLKNIPFKFNTINNSKYLDLVEKMIQYKPSDRISFPQLFNTFINNTQQTEIKKNSIRNCASTLLSKNNIQQNSLQQIKFTPNQQAQQINQFNQNQRQKTEPECFQKSQILNQQNDQKFQQEAKQINFQNQAIRQSIQFQNQTTPQKQETQLPQSSLNIKQLPQFSPSQQSKQNSNPTQFNSSCEQGNVNQFQNKNFNPMNNQINVFSTIQVYLQDVLNNQYFLMKDDIYNKLISITQNQRFGQSDEQIKNLLTIFQLDKSKIDQYNFNYLQFHYCLRNHNEQTIKKMEMWEIKQYLRNISE